MKKILLLLIGTSINIAFESFVVYKIYTWFIENITNLIIEYYNFIGIILLLAIIKLKYTDKEDTNEELIGKFITSFVMYLLVLGYGYLFKILL